MRTALQVAVKQYCFDIRHNDVDKSFAACFNRAEILFRKLTGTERGAADECQDALKLCSTAMQDCR
ncbi:hypothetical protein [Thermincola ferriacetica]|uniref:hypothetical protein n=1 Tax=Thermincola ferriacetica TaxID=281456 RepID=UPI00069179C8|nr:hypothetical protein [Thermincola ferriacetica]